MPPLPVVPNVVKIVIEGTSTSGYRWANILHAGYGGSPPTLGNAQAIATAVQTSWATHVSPLQSTVVTEEEVVVTDLASAMGAVGIDATPNVGTGSGSEMGANMCLLVDYPIALRFRGGHPRSYLYIGAQADLLDSGHWSTTFTAAAQTAWRAFLAGFLNTAYGACNVGDLVLVSYVNKVVNPVPPYRRPTPLVTPLSHATAIAIGELASQRRRIGRK